jgi:hypothetical protein
LHAESADLKQPPHWLQVAEVIVRHSTGCAGLKIAWFFHQQLFHLGYQLSAGSSGKIVVDIGG